MYVFFRMLCERALNLREVAHEFYPVIARLCGRD